MKLTQNTVAAALGGVIVVAVVGWLAFGYFGIQAAFTDTEVTEAGPSFESGAVSDSEGSAEGNDEAADGQLQSAAADEGSVDPAGGASDGGGNEGSATGEVTTLASGGFTDDSGHSVAGEAVVLNDGTEQRFLRLQQFESDNGPDLNVYLRADDGEFVDLGDLKGNIGDQNYEIPTDVDLARFNTVQIWCVRFSVSFGAAVLA